MKRASEYPVLHPMDSDAYREFLQQCVHCGLCLEACPTYSLFGVEMEGPRGRIALMQAAAQGRIDPQTFTRTFADHVTLCLECRACESACPSGVQYGKLVEGARVALEKERTPGLPERFVRWLGMEQLMPHVGQLKALARLMWLYEASGMQHVVRRLNVLPDPLRAMEGILPPIDPRYPDYRRPAPAMGERRGTVAFFYGCIQEAFLASINAATIRVLQRNGYEVHFPQEQTCCGAAQWHTGDEELARELARKNVDAFLDGGYEAIVNNAGGCGLTLKEYPDLLADDPDYAERARRFAAKVQDVSEFLAAHLHEPPEGELRVRATYADSCHLRHGQQVVDAPRALLRMIPGLELVELRHPERCCGSAGIYNIAQPETADALLEEKMADVAATGAGLLVTSNTGCHMQLVAGVRRAGLNVHVLHVAEVLDLAYRDDDRRLREEIRQSHPLFGRGWRTPERGLAWLAQRRREAPPPAPLDALHARLQPGQLLTDPLACLTYALDAGIDAGQPVAVAFPYTTDDVQAIARWASEHDVPLVARGAGTGLAGGAIADRGGVLVAFSQMREIVDLDAAGRTALVQPGVVNLALDEMARAHGLSFPPDPASGRSATLGGNVGANAGGPHCFKYGVTTNYVTGLELVLANGDAVRLGGQALDVPEYDLVGVVVGSEGTLGAVTEVAVGLRRPAPAVRTMMAAFDSVEQAGEAVSEVIARGLIPATLEMMDRKIVRIVEEFVSAGLPVDAGAVLIVETDGYAGSVGPQMEEISAALEARGAYDLQIAETEEQREKIWYGRKSAVGALARLAPAYCIFDGTVPRSRLAETLTGVTRICEALDLQVGYVFHAGDGNLHPLVLIDDPDDAELLARVHEAGRQVSALCVEQRGSITGEHGVGVEKRAFMPLMYTPEELSAMRELKQVFDPGNLMNPDKLLPDRIPSFSLPTLSPAPGSPFAPTSAGEAAAGLRAWAVEGRVLRIVSRAPAQVWHDEGAILSTERLSGLLTYAPDDLYVRVGAGTPWDELQAALAEDGTWIPAVAPGEGATVGGMLAANCNAPLRMRYGALRDLVLALTVVLPDGRLIRAGRPVMKNVAGYDLAKLFVGSHGTLGLIADATFKLWPLPRARRTRAVAIDDLSAGFALGAELLRGALVASAIVLVRGAALPGLGAGTALLYTAEGEVQDVDAELERVDAALAASGAPSAVDVATAGSAAWSAWLRQAPPGATVVRAGVAPGALPSFARAVLPGAGGDVAFFADVASGHLYLRGTFDVDAVRAAAHDCGDRYPGYALVLQPGSYGGERSGHRPEGLPLMRALKARWDPRQRFNPRSWMIQS